MDSIYIPPKSKTYHVEHHGKTFELLLVTSVAKYRASMFPRYLRWRVIDDESFLKDLITQAQVSPTSEILEALLAMEILYKEINSGKASEGSTEDQVTRVRRDKITAERDISSVGLKADSLDVQVESQERPTLGELADEVKKQLGKSRNAWRSEKKNKTPNK